MSRARLALLVALAAVVLRLPVLLCHADTWFPFEVHSGNIALGLLEGLRMDWPRLPIMPHIRGNVLFALGQAASFAVLGPTALALKLVPMLWHAATLALAAALVDRFWTRRAAATTALLLLFAPPLLANLATLGFASHLESTLPMLLAAWPFLAITADGRRERRLFFLLGLATGFSGFFHLQALLPCLILLGLLLLQEPRACFGRPGLALLLGLALGAAPSWLFEDGNLAYLGWTFRGGRGLELEDERMVELLADRASPAAKLRALLTGDFLLIMGFPETPDGAGGSRRSPLGTVYGLLLLAAVASAVWRRRQPLLALVRRAAAPWRRSRERVSMAAPFLLHPLAMLAMTLTAKTRVNVELTGVGFENRRMAPLLFSLLVLAGLGLSADGLRRVRVAVLVVMLAICGFTVARDIAPVSDWPPMQAGAIPEWFAAQLFHHARHDLQATAATIARIDFGDARFRSLRFRAPLSDAALKPQDVLALEAGRRKRMPPALAAWRATALGRLLGRTPGRVPLAELVQHAQSLPVVEREALLHGFGLGFVTPRPLGRPGVLNRGLATMRGTFAALPARIGEAAAEGLGFDQGSTYDPYNDYRTGFLQQLAQQLPPHQQAAFARGFGWGYRQRFGVDVPADLAGQKVVRHLPEPLHAAFLEGYHARVLPREAEAGWPAAE